MSSVTLQMVDYMDSHPLPGASLNVRLRVFPVFKPPPGGSGGQIPVELPADASLFEELSAAATTDAEGRAVVHFDDAASFRRMARARVNGVGAIGAVGSVRVSATFLDIEFEPRFVASGFAQGAAIDRQVRVDLGTAIVGHTTPHSVRLWFMVPFEPSAAHEFTCHLVTLPEKKSTLTAQAGSPSDRDVSELGRSEPVSFRNQDANTAIVDFDKLAADASHDYVLRVRHRPTGRRFGLATGRFNTPGETQASLSFAFGSCHLPTGDVRAGEDDPSAVASLRHWQRLADQSDFELLLLIGDQIYGDGIDKKWPNDDPFTRYVRRYRQLWAHRPMRNVLRSKPTYMILDDHDVRDDFGSGPGHHAPAALRAYRRFQHIHNPGAGGESPFHYAFRWGPASFFVMDGRTQRGEGTPVFGRRQLDDLRRWARDDATLSADVIVFVAPIPLALLPTEVIRKIARQLSEDAARALATLAGFLIGAPFLGAVLGVVGYELLRDIVEDALDRNMLYDFDLAERWDRDDNQPDLVQTARSAIQSRQWRRRDPPSQASDLHLIRRYPCRNDASHSIGAQGRRQQACGEFDDFSTHEFVNFAGARELNIVGGSRRSN